MGRWACNFVNIFRLVIYLKFLLDTFTFKPVLQVVKIYTVVHELRKNFKQLTFRTAVLRRSEGMI